MVWNPFAGITRLREMVLSPEAAVLLPEGSGALPEQTAGIPPGLVLPQCSAA